MKIVALFLFADKERCGLPGLLLDSGHGLRIEIDATWSTVDSVIA